MEVNNKCVNELRVLSIEMISKAGSGHPGIALSSAPILFALYSNILNYNYKDDNFFNRDRFVLSAGHGSAILYSILYAFKFNISKNDLKNFRSNKSELSGHPELSVSGVDCATGPLGQGVSNAVGMAIAEKILQNKFNVNGTTVLNNKVFCLVGDGCLMEGISYEALSLAGNLNLNNLVLIYDRNKKTIEGSTDLTFTENIKLRFKSIGFNVFNVKNGNSVIEITKKLQLARLSKKPSIVICNTKIGYGSVYEDNEKSHGNPFSESQIEHLIKNLHVHKPDFDLSELVKQYCGDIAEKKRREAEAFIENIKQTEEYKNYCKFVNTDINTLLKKLDTLELPINKGTRELNHELFQKIIKFVPNLIGGSADVCSSTKVFVANSTDFSAENYGGINIHFGVREHAMAGICNGMALYGLLPYCSCFLSFSDYLKPALRMSALMNLPVLYFFSHDSIFLGEDGPTHQPIEQISTLRSIPKCLVFRPYNSKEIIDAYKHYFKNKQATCILLNKQKQTEVEFSKCCDNYNVVINKDDFVATIIATGFDVNLAMEVNKILEGKKNAIKVISVPCRDLLLNNLKAFQTKELNKKPVFIIEASNDLAWLQVCKKYGGDFFGISDFGISASGSIVADQLDFTAIKIAEKINDYLKQNK